MMEISSENAGGGASRSHFYDIVSLENLFRAWDKFRKGKEKKSDVQRFAMNLEDNLFELHHKLLDETYQHSAYVSFFVHDPKLRHIHKATVVDRVLHHAIMNVIEPVFEKGFIFDSYSSRKGKGTHRAVRRLRQFAWRLSRNNTKTVWALQCDIRRFFDSVDHSILKRLICKRIRNEKAVGLILRIIDSFCVENGKGMPLGNMTSQLFSNIYMNPFDQFIKRKIRMPFYLRYADDFVILAEEKILLEKLIPIIADFLKEKLALNLHPKKIQIRKWNQGVDFLGYISLPHHTLLRTKTKRRILKKIQKRRFELAGGKIDDYTFTQSQQSYLGILKHCRGYNVEVKIKTLAK